MKRPTRRSFLASSAAVAATSLSPRTVRANGRLLQGDAMGEAGAQLADAAPFLAAVRRGDLPMVRRFVAATPALASCTDAEGRSALVLAYLHGRAEVAQVLVASGIELDLAEAVMSANWDRATALLDAHPELIDAPHPVGGTALYAAARAGETGTWRLQGRGADADGNPFGERGVTPAYGAFECELWNDAVRVSNALLANGADVNAPQRGGDSLLHAAARRGDPYLVRFVLRKGGDVGARNDEGETPLEHARRCGNDAVALVLARHSDVPRDDQSARLVFDASGGEVVWPDMSGLTLEQQGQVTGASHKDLAKVRQFVEAEPRLAFSFSGQRELTIEASSHTGANEVARFLLDQGVPLSLTTALSIGDLARASELLEERPTRVHERGAHDFAAMWFTAIGGGSIEAAELLLKHGCEVDQESEGTTALHWAVSNGQLDLITYLVEQGADLQAVGYKWEREGETPLQHATARGEDAAAKRLRELGAF